MKEQRRPASSPASYAATWSASWAPGQYQSAGLKNVYSLNFDGTDDQLLIPYELSGTNFSISFWFKQSDTANGEYLFDSRNSSSQAFAAWATYHSSSNSVSVTAWCGTTITGTTKVAIGTWAHVAITKSGNTVTIYVNGELDVATTNATFGTITTSDIKVGTRYNGVNAWAGNIDEISVFTTALSATDVVDLYNAGTPNDVLIMSPSGWWRNGDATIPADDGTNGFIFDQADPGLGAEVVPSPDFSSASGWDLPSGVTISGGKMSIDGNVGLVNLYIDLDDGVPYKVTYEVSNYSSGIAKSYINGTQGTVYTANGTYTEYIAAGSANTRLGFNPSGVFDIDSFSVKRVNGATATINGATIETDTP